MLRHHLAELIESDQCISVSSQNIAKIRNGTLPQNKLKSIVDEMRSEGCGMAHVATIDPAKSSRLQTLSKKQYSVFKVDASHDNVFHALLHGTSFVVNHRPASAAVLKRSTKPLRLAVVELVLKTATLQDAMSRDPSRPYHRQFLVRQGSEERYAFSEYSKKMRSTAFASYAEIAALAMYSGIEVHIYDETPSGFVFIVRYTPTTTQKKKRYVIRLVRGAKSHVDLLIPNAYHTHREFWNRVNKNVLGRLGGTAANTPETALEKLQSSKNMMKNAHRLPNENKNAKNNFSWNASPKLHGGDASS